MNLVIDAGNTYVKLAIFDRNILKEKNVIAYEDFNVVLKEVLETYPDLENAIIASVGRFNSDMMSSLGSDLNILELSHNLKFPFENTYETPLTLGVDRIALVCAALDQFPNNNVLVIDAGTCITYDFINLKNQYLGGAISPGIRLRYKSLNDFTANLPLLHTEMPISITGNSTQQSIHSGVVYGVLKEIDGVIEEYADNYSDLTVILTGGDAKFLSNQLKNSIFANSNFLLEGLNFILEYNTHL